MSTAALVDVNLARRRAQNAERQRRWRAAGAKDQRARRQNHGDDIGPAIAEGEPFVDDFDRCEEKWSALMAGARFSDVLAPRR